MSDAAEQRTRATDTDTDSPHYLLWFVSTFAAVLVFYLFSIGPVVRVYGLTTPVLDAYYPVFHLCGHSPGERLLDWYLGVWGVDVGRYR